MSLEAYLNASEDAPLIIELRGERLKAKNLNALPWKLLFQVTVYNRFGTMGFNPLLNKVLSPAITKTLSHGQKAAILKASEEQAGWEFNEVLSIGQIIEQYPNEFSIDLRERGISGISGLLDLKPIDAIEVMRDILSDNEGAVVSKHRGWDHRFSRMEWILFDLYAVTYKKALKNPASWDPRDYPRLPYRNAPKDVGISGVNEEVSDMSIEEEERLFEEIMKAKGL